MSKRRRVEGEVVLSHSLKSYQYIRKDFFIKKVKDLKNPLTKLHLTYLKNFAKQENKNIRDGTKVFLLFIVICITF